MDELGRASTQPTNIDKHVGIVLQQYRVAAGTSIEQLADETGLSHQDIQNYETGISHVSAQDLVSLAQSLDVPMTALFPSPEDTKTTDNEVSRLRGEASALLDSIVNPRDIGTAVTLLRLIANSPA